ncbi:uncharacterized protein LOC124914852 [Impatiens glandulifera]|uniref:uncharacterized protein LOC124914852 n=1 Tax=Impatiens glandulifera TaxID=253017 RepID=UPI001FB07F73|nr:uncharacterized protein LOC124914852 [Impatiens glandulifera]XP_047311425.1 uncharacterized protein LOC124914852 [Impatiens glandulifera]XP_047311426.1 uncharacterized protein LOC124914852 [Impatiens glandulifera]
MDMRRNSLACRNLGTYTSPGTPEYHNQDINGGILPRGWSSERVTFSTNSGRRHTNSVSALMPLSSGRTLPSKWDDAERWITSPISGFIGGRVLPAQAQIQPMSKSGPLGAQDEGFSNYSPFTTGVLVADGLSIHYSGRHGNGVYCNPLHNVERHGWSDLLSDNGTDEKIDGSKDDHDDDEEGLVSRVVSRRDMATQMSPDNSSKHSSFSTSPPAILTIDDDKNNNNSDSSRKLEIRDVQVDKRANHVTKQSKKLRKNNNLASDDLTSSWEIAETEKNISRFQREDAKITAWENLQKAKAEAEIRKLEMKLEKKRSSRMDKILSKLRTAQMKAEEMRSSASSDIYTSQAASPPKRSLFSRHFLKANVLGSCFASRVL